MLADERLLLLGMLAMQVAVDFVDHGNGGESFP